MIKLFALLFILTFTAPVVEAAHGDNLKVYVMVGFHVDFYHSWRGDTPDEMGYGYDKRIITSSINKLNKAQAAKKKAKVYWDFAANNWTFGEFVPQHFPELIDLWKGRDNHDEFIMGPFNNGMNSAATKKEFLKGLEWTLNNPGGYGLEQMFKNVGHIYRPQEMSFASGQVNWLHEGGVKALILQYASYSFNSISNFIAPLSDEERFNPLYFKSHETDKPIVLLPTMSPIDLINFNSLKSLMIKLRKKQLSGEITRNVVIHLNMDADASSWEPQISSNGLRKLVPNTGGLQEIIDVVNDFSWSDFTTPSEYLKIEQPKKTILVKQDTADGAFDGMATWAEKESTQVNWTKVEMSRAYERFLENQSSSFKHRDLWTDDGFMNRFLTLSTTHYGMSVPFIHFERQARLEKYSAKALDIRRNDYFNSLDIEHDQSSITFNEYPRYGQDSFSPASAVNRQKVIVSKASSLVPVGVDYTKKSLDKTQDIIEIYRTSETNQKREISLVKDSSIICKPTPLSTFNEGGLEVEFSTETGIKSIMHDGQMIGDNDFLSPFISFREKSEMTTFNKPSAKSTILIPKKYSLSSEYCATAPNIREVKMQTQIDLHTKKKTYQTIIDYRVWKDTTKPYLFLDVKANLPYTIDETSPEHADRRLRKHIDYRWQEIALSQLKPKLGTSSILNVWKMNYEGLISNFKVNYDEINKKNKNIDVLNNQITPGWLALSNGKRGILVAFNAMKRSSFGAIPLRVRTDDNGNKTFAMNPFGTYYGKQLDYSHVGGEKLGTSIANAGAPYIRPIAPSFVGKSVSYELMIIPYDGDRPSTEMIKTALSFAYPALSTVSLPEQNLFEDGFTHALKADVGTVTSTLEAPAGLAAAALDQSAAVTWANSETNNVDGYQILWRKINDRQWQTMNVDSKKRSVMLTNLENGEKYDVVARSHLNGKYSELSTHQFIKPDSNIVDAEVNPVSISLRMLYYAAGMVLENRILKDPSR